MLKPYELTLDLPMQIYGSVVSTTTKVWEILVASKEGNLDRVMEMVHECPEIIFAKYNYTPPIHLAVREGHTDLVGYLLTNGAYDIEKMLLKAGAFV